jgi:hypothetical protein
MSHDCDRSAVQLSDDSGNSVGLRGQGVVGFSWTRRAANAERLDDYRAETGRREH